MGLVAVLGSCSEELIIQDYAPASGYDVKIECDSFYQENISGITILDLTEKPASLFRGIKMINAHDYDVDGQVDDIRCSNIPSNHSLEKLCSYLKLNKLIRELSKECHKK